jgi:hypothetical protein
MNFLAVIKKLPSYQFREKNSYFSSYLQPEASSQRVEMSYLNSNQKVVIAGIAGRFPRSRTVAEFKANLFCALCSNLNNNNDPHKYRMRAGKERAKNPTQRKKQQPQKKVASIKFNK